MVFPYGSSWLASALALLLVGCASDSVEQGAVGPTGGTGATEGSGGASLGGGGGAGPSQVFLGRACQTDVDCGELLRCLQSESLGDTDEAPAGGYCTIPCETEAGCATFAPVASCRELTGGRSYCVLGCEFGPAALGDKCHGRRDVACVATDDESSPTCVPRCSDDAQCCSDSASCDSYCNPATGLCGTAPVEGQAIGAPCEGPGDPGCRGNCVQVADGMQDYVCTEVCTFGSFPACGWRPSEGPAPAYCYFATEVVDALGRAAGDGGLCAQLCDCDDDCDAAYGCEPFADELDALATQRLGVCAATEAISRPCAGGGAGGAEGQPASGGGREPRGGSGNGGAAASGGAPWGGASGRSFASVAGEAAIVGTAGAGGVGATDTGARGSGRGGAAGWNAGGLAGR